MKPVASVLYLISEDKKNIFTALREMAQDNSSSDELIDASLHRGESMVFETTSNVCLLLKLRVHNSGKGFSQGLG
jgi:hypothetical protein